MPSRLGQMLKAQRNFFKQTLSDIAARAQEVEDWPKGLGRSSAFFSNVERGIVEIKEKHYRTYIAAVYQIEPFILNAIVQPTPVSNAIIVNPETDFEAEYNVLSTKNVEYKIAKFRLHDSGFTISYVHLQPGAKGPIHKHRGEEFNFCYQGELKLVFPDFPEKESYKTVPAGSFIHFNAENLHYGENIGKSTAIFLIIRRHGLPRQDNKSV